MRNMIYVMLYGVNVFLFRTNPFEIKTRLHVIFQLIFSLRLSFVSVSVFGNFFPKNTVFHEHFNHTFEKLWRFLKEITLFTFSFLLTIAKTINFYIHVFHNIWYVLKHLRSFSFLRKHRTSRVEELCKFRFGGNRYATRITCSRKKLDTT